MGDSTKYVGGIYVRRILSVKFLCLTTIIKAYCSVGVYVWIAICKIEYRHIIFTFAHGIVLQMALHIYVFINNVEWEVSLKYKG